MICSVLLVNAIQLNFEEHLMTNESKSHSGESGNFASDRNKASEAGRKGGEKGGQQSHHGQSKKSPQGGSEESARQHVRSGNFANNPDKASEAGRKGGEHSHGRR
jgi:general stress protein YciG